MININKYIDLLEPQKKADTLQPENEGKNGKIQTEKSENLSNNNKCNNNILKKIDFYNLKDFEAERKEIAKLNTDDLSQKTFISALGKIVWMKDEKKIVCEGAIFLESEILALAENGGGMSEFELELKRKFKGLKFFPDYKFQLPIDYEQLNKEINA